MADSLTPPPFGSLMHLSFPLDLQPPFPKRIFRPLFFSFFYFFFSFGGCFALVRNTLAVWELPNSGDVSCRYKKLRRGEYKIQMPFTDDSNKPVSYTEYRGALKLCNGTFVTFCRGLSQCPHSRRSVCVFCIQQSTEL